MSGAWSLPFAVPEEACRRARRVAAVLFDVDGVLTDGSLLIGGNGEEYKVFDVHDGHGFHLLAAGGIVAGIITARSSPAVQQRARELGLRHCYMGRKNKLSAFAEFLGATGLTEDQCCYVGDDVIDLPVMLRCGLAVAVANANHVVLRSAHGVTPKAGGSGAARQVCEMLLHAQDKFDSVIAAYLKLGNQR